MIYLASYTDTHNSWHGLINRAIRFVTRSKYSHTEVCFGNPFEGAVPCLSSSGVDGGVRVKTMKLNPKKWEIIPAPWATEESFWAVYEKHKGDKYDYLGAGWFAFPIFVIQSRKRKFCSEIAAEALGFVDSWRYYPGILHRVVEQMVNVKV